MKNKFKKWMKETENKLQSTIYQYTLSIDKISKHYSKNIDKNLDIYNETDLDTLKNIAKYYDLDGKYSDFGNQGNGTVRNALATYIRFLESMETEQKSENFNENNLSEDIQKLIYIIDNNEDKKRNWTKYILEFHEVWLKHKKNIPIKLEGKYIWGKKVLIDPNASILEIFNEDRDKNILEFFDRKNKIFINEIMEEDLIQIIFQKNFKFIDFKRIINKLFMKNEIIKNKMTEEEITRDEITNLVDRSINNIKGELDIFKTIMNHYDSIAAQLNQEISLRDERLIKQEHTINILIAELEKTKEPLEELQNIRKNLEEIKSMLEVDNLF